MREAPCGTVLPYHAIAAAAVIDPAGFRCGSIPQSPRWQRRRLGRVLVAELDHAKHEFLPKVPTGQGLPASSLVPVRARKRAVIGRTLPGSLL
jgi:hypothetical protein